MGTSNPLFLIDFSQIHAISLPPCCLIFLLFFFLLRFLFLLFFRSGSKWGRGYWWSCWTICWALLIIVWVSIPIKWFQFLLLCCEEGEGFIFLFSSGFSWVAFPLLCSINRTIGHSKSFFFLFLIFPFLLYLILMDQAETFWIPINVIVQESILKLQLLSVLFVN